MLWLGFNWYYTGWYQLKVKIKNILQNNCKQLIKKKYPLKYWGSSIKNMIWILHKINRIP